MSDVARNIETVKGIYAAFGKGDVPAILERIADDVDWEFGASDHGVPWLVHGRGREAVTRFFGQVAAELEFLRFDVRAVMGEGEWAVALIELEARSKKTGKTFREACEAHIWRFDAKGRVVAMRHAADTWAHAQALR